MHADEIATGARFAFGENWHRFLATLSEPQIAAAQAALSEMLESPSLDGLSFLDVGSGSGLSSLVASRLGARVASFDYDPRSVATTNELKRRYHDGRSGWTVEEGSALDLDYLAKLGTFDIVYSWGVLHHTGSMWPALSNVAGLVAERGRLFVAIYNDQGWISRYWHLIKRIYNMNGVGRLSVIALHLPYLVARWIVRALAGRLQLERGMSLWHDMIDWLGGYPFEVARPEQIVKFYRSRGFVLTALKTCGGRLGCNEFVFSKVGVDDAPASKA